MRTLPLPVRWLLYLLGAFYVLYLAAGNLFLNTPIGPRTINRKPATFHAEWSWAWTAWPGGIHVYDLHVAGHARKLLWSGHGESASGRLMLWPLLRREMRFGPIDASAMTIDIQPTPVDRKPPAWRSDAWRITFDRIDATKLRSMHMGEWVLEGEGVGSAGFTHQLRGGTSVVFPSRVSMPDARLRRGQQAFLEHAKVDVDFALDSFTHDQPPGMRKLERATVRVQVDGATPAIALGADKNGALAVTTTALDGRLTADVSLDHGTLAPGGRLHWNAAVAVTDGDGSQQRLHGQLDMAVQQNAIGLRARIPAPANRHGATKNELQADLSFASRHVTHRDFVDAVSLLSGTVETRWHFASLRWLTPMLASARWLRLDGEGDIDASLRIEHGKLMPGSRLDVPRAVLGANILDNVFAGKAHAQGQVVAGSKGAKIAVGLVVDRFTLSPQATPGKAYLRGQALQVDLRSSADLATFGDTLNARLHFDNATVPDLRTYNRYLPGKSLAFESGAGRMSADLTLDGKGDVGAGRLRMVAEGTRIALGISHLIGNLHVDTQLARAKRAGHAFDLENFALGLDGVRVQGSSDPPWWVRATLEKGRLDWDRPMRLSGRATLTMKDVSLLLSLYAERSAFPKWIAKVIDDGQATAHGLVDVQDGTFVLDDVVASNKRVDLFARLRIANGQPSGNLYARWGVLGLAVALDNGKRDFHMVNAARWYREQPAFIPAKKASPND
jgi:hypothetical protein